MKMKFSIIAAVLAAGFASQANATIDASGGMNTQLFLTVWDPVALVSYSRGLGLTVGSMSTGAGISFGTSTTGSGFTATGDTTRYTLAADTNLSSFLTTYAADAASMQWSVVGGGGPNVNYVNPLLVTSNSMTSVGWNSSNFGGMIAFNGNYLSTSTGINSLMPAGSVAGNTDSAVATSANGPAYALATTAYFGANLGNVTVFNTAAALGAAQSFYLLDPTTNGRSYGGAPVIYQFANAAGASNFTLGTNGTLTYTSASVAAVPEPSEIGLMLSGFGLVGFLANKRRKALKG